MQTCTQCESATTFGEFEDGLCDGCWLFNQVPTTAAEAREIAMDWQNCVSNESLSYSEHVEWANHFRTLAEQFGLVDEFIENGII